jgi:gluconate kinase
MGCSGSGKTFSALRLATGIQEVTGGDIYGIDTEARRMLHYADQFKFKHVQFDAPFGSLDYLAAIRHCVDQGAKVIVIDSMTHEHTGPGGYLLTQEAEVNRMAGDDYAKRERVKMAGWIKPAGLRQQMITGILQLNANFIFCFRAKEKTKPVKGGGIQELGFMPIAGEELLFEQTVNCLLPPKSGGVPQWRSDQVGEKLMMKLPKQFEAIFAEPEPLSELIGKKLAQWAKGSAAAAVDDDDRMAWDSKLATAALQGIESLRETWGMVPVHLKKSLKAAMDNRHKPAAKSVIA